MAATTSRVKVDLPEQLGADIKTYIVDRLLMNQLKKDKGITPNTIWRILGTKTIMPEHITELTEFIDGLKNPKSTMVVVEDDSEG
jgi:hypothetical protein